MTFVLPEQQEDVSRVARLAGHTEQFASGGMKVAPPRACTPRGAGARSGARRPRAARSDSAQDRNLRVRIPVARRSLKAAASQPRRGVAIEPELARPRAAGRSRPRPRRDRRRVRPRSHPRAARAPSGEAPARSSELDRRAGRRAALLALHAVADDLREIERIAAAELLLRVRSRFDQISSLTTPSSRRVFCTFLRSASVAGGRRSSVARDTRKRHRSSFPSSMTTTSSSTDRARPLLACGDAADAVGWTRRRVPTVSFTAQAYRRGAVCSRGVAGRRRSRARGRASSPASSDRGASGAR